jgi:hypothetical protein
MISRKLSRIWGSGHVCYPMGKVRYNENGEKPLLKKRNMAKLVWRYRMRYTKSSWLVIIIALSLVLSACTLGQEPEPTPDVGAIFTAAAETVSAQFSLELTQTALAAPTATQPPANTPTPENSPIPTFSIEGTASPTPLGAITPLASPGIGTQPASIIPTATPLAGLATQAGPVCRDSAFIADINYPDGTVVEDNVLISKRWSIQNTGTCAWDDGFSLQPVTGDAQGTYVIDEVNIKKVEPGEIRELEIDIRTPKKGGEWGGCWRMMGDDGYFFGTFLCLLVVVE